MTPEMVLDIGKEAGEIIILLSAPPLLAGLIIGLIISMIQAATQIQEMTLSFIPKLLGIGAALVFTGHWMLSLITDYVTRLYHSIPNLIG
ncbi:flagellar biosynthesis protein FliQ [Chromatium okenii]|jgi:flagellar biosynthetic protein FliQ|uniref:Flagellar biosynthetic protein FliQ n=1 Tax=Chromatium okenii TaxID=61644 RepID=A0A2S7XND7_9GAMM|nr:flagellar biosynthesis protein FliQ [Chromatium okenii]MBV5308632.1 flagellar biosynthesis protein FliQ [Chromatium okenii]PQJ95257.1 flagellar biosynthetic protein FliQ [Chromatium okenii]